MAHPHPIADLLTPGLEQLHDIVEQTGRLLARVTLLELAVRRLPAEVELTASRLSRLATDLREAHQDGRAALRSWQDGR